MSIAASGAVARRIYAVWVEDRPGVLNRVTSLFRRRGFNIESISSGQARQPGLARMTIVVKADETGARRLAVLLSRLVNVLRVDDITSRPAIHHELAMFKVSASGSARSEVITLALATGARLVDVAPESVVIEASSSPKKIDALAEVLRPYGILEQLRTGLVAMARAADSVMSDPEARTAPVARRPARPASDDSGSV